MIGAAARALVTTHGRTIAAPVAGTHGTATWTSENAAFTPSAETITQASLSAYKAGAKIIVSEELLEDALEDFDRFLSEELGQRVAALEASADPSGRREASSPSPPGGLALYAPGTPAEL